MLIAREQSHTRVAYDLEFKKALEASQQRVLAEKASKQARDAVDFFSRIAIGMDRPEFSDIRREMLEESLSYYQSFLEDHASSAAELGAARATVAAFLNTSPPSTPACALPQKRNCCRSCPSSVS